MQNIFEPLTDEELDRLDAFLLDRIDEDADTIDKDEGILDIAELDGFLTAIISGPRVIMPSSWLPAVWGDFEPAWKDQQDFEEIVTLITRHMNGIAATLMEQPQDFEPIFLEREIEGKTYMVVDEWCGGYMRGVELTPSDWEEGGEEVYDLLLPILMFTTETGWEALKKLNKDEVEELQLSIAPTVREVHAYWLARRSNPADELSRAEPIRRTAPKIGRNDPCPCGSGRKYKLCCGAH